MTYPFDETNLIISRHELHNKDFVWHCILEFRQKTSFGIWGDDLVIMWGKDYLKLLESKND